MKRFTFRITQDLIGYYEASVDIEASSEKEARKKLKNMTTNEISEIAYDWTQNTDNAEADGEIEIQDLKEEEEI